MHGEVTSRNKSFFGKLEETTRRDLSTDGKEAYMSIKMNPNEKGYAELSGLRLDAVAGPSENGHALFCFTKGGKF
jgi:hypothetical protein